MTSYEVTATVRDDLRTRYEVFLRERHIPDVLATGCFAGAHLLRGDDGRYSARYEVLDRPSLERYVGVHAPRLRADLLAHFPEGVELERGVWTELVAWPH